MIGWNALRGEDTFLGSFGGGNGRDKIGSFFFVKRTGV
jgi:hypothetical protein